jgi:hypothetical protein
MRGGRKEKFEIVGMKGRRKIGKDGMEGRKELFVG